ncbi:hypothetical protein [Halobaculum sp. MBLA0143]|uniref:hypothetical protein n=1 Tax=Halobaculum sp. MBLA0143 TaxID=3079933 RepID=UPI003523FEA2
MRRRSLLSACGTAALGVTLGSTPAAAAVTHEGHDSDETDTDGPVATVREYYRLSSKTTSVDGFAVDARRLSHRVSPLSDPDETPPMLFDDALRQRVTAASVTEEAVTTTEIGEMSSFFAGWLSTAELRRVAAETVVVTATLTDPQIVGGTFQVGWLVAPEPAGSDGDDEERNWRLLWPVGANTPQSAVREYYRQAATAADGEAFALEVRELAHEVSPLATEDGVPAMALQSETSLRFTDTALADRGLTADEVSSLSGFLDGWLSEDDLAAVADENALVDVTLASDDTGGPTLQWLVATEDDDWRLVWIDEP